MASLVDWDTAEVGHRRNKLPWIPLTALIPIVFLFGNADAALPTDTVVVAQGVDAATLDPAQISSRDSANIADHLWVTLFEVDENGQMKPYLAQSYVLADDRKSITYRLVPGQSCEDGEPMDADAVAYSFNRAADPANHFFGNTAGFVFPSVGFKKAVALDPTTVRIEMDHYNPIAPQLLTEVYLHCSKAYADMTLDQAARKPIASGPYHLVEWARDDHITLERTPGFTLRPALPRRIVWRVVPEPMTRSAELIAGNADIITNVVPDQMGSINDSGTASVQVVEGTRRMSIAFSQNQKFAGMLGGRAIEQPQVRHALQYAVDVPTICESLLKTPCRRATGPVNPPHDDPALKPYPYDPDEAERLLDQAGYKRGPDGVRFTLTLQSPNGRYLSDSAVAQAVGQYLDDIGVQTKVEFLDWATAYTQQLNTHQIGPLFLMGNGGRTYSALSDLTLFSAPDAGTNYPDWHDPEFFAQWPIIETATDQATIDRAVTRMLEIFYERGPWLLLYFQPDLYGVSHRITWHGRRDERLLVNDVVVH